MDVAKTLRLGRLKKLAKKLGIRLGARKRKHVRTVPMPSPVPVLVRVGGPTREEFVGHVMKKGQSRAQAEGLWKAQHAPKHHKKKAHKRHDAGPHVVKTLDLRTGKWTSFEEFVRHVMKKGQSRAQAEGLWKAQHTKRGKKRGKKRRGSRRRSRSDHEDIREKAARFP